MDITKHNEKVWDEYLNNDYGNYKNGYSKSDRDTMNIILFGINGVEDKRVLDLGVGTGRSTEMLLSQSKEYLATDYSPSGITICKNNFQMENLWLMILQKDYLLMIIVMTLCF